jgi:hypothetical protein
MMGLAPSAIQAVAERALVAVLGVEVLGAVLVRDVPVDLRVPHVVVDPVDHPPYLI